MSTKKKVSEILKGVNHLVLDATIGVTNLAESVHKQVVNPPFLPSTAVQHLITNLASITYNRIRWSAYFLGKGTDIVLAHFSTALGEVTITEEKEALRAVLNGVVGDYLEENQNPLAIDMQFRHQGQALTLHKKNINEAYETITSKVLILVHGSCLSDTQWTRKEHNHGEKLAQELNQTLVYLHYNSGLHVSTNGQRFNEILEELVKNWPVPLEELTFISHSMGGLVARSAVHYGHQQEKLWTTQLKKVFFLGTPHHGAPLENAGNYLETILEAIPYSRPFARLGKIRSAGVTDLRYGNLIDEDWEDNTRFKLEGDKRKGVQLTENVEFYSIAAALGKEIELIPTQWVGDILVSANSALGQHEDPLKKLLFKKENTWIAYEHNHMDLLSSLEVYAKIKNWIA